MSLWTIDRLIFINTIKIVIHVQGFLNFILEFDGTIYIIWQKKLSCPLSFLRLFLSRLFYRVGQKFRPIYSSLLNKTSKYKKERNFLKFI